MIYKAHIKGVDKTTGEDWSKIVALEAVDMDSANAEVQSIIASVYINPEDRLVSCEIYAIAALTKIDMADMYKRIDDPAYNEEAIRQKAQIELSATSNRKYPGSKQEPVS